jgi:hypothetical protein
MLNLDLIDFLAFSRQAAMDNATVLFTANSDDKIGFYQLIDDYGYAA